MADDATQPPALAAATLAVHAGRPPRDPGAPVSVPPVLTSTYAAGGAVGYARSGNPSWEAFEAALAALEGPGCRCLAFASGMAATSAVLDLIPTGATVVAASVAYSGTRALLHRADRARRIRLREVDTSTEALVAACRTGAGLVWLESPANPTLAILDIAAVAAAARSVGALVVVDSTFATPLGQHPLDLGADVAVHSATKYLSGHSDVLLGAAVVRDAALADGLAEARVLGGGVPDPMSAWLALRGLRTFPLRWERMCASATRIAASCAEHPAVASVRHPGRADHPGHAVAAAQMASFGAIVTIELHGGAAAAEAVAAGTRLWLHATSLGGVESSLERRRRWPEESPDVPESLLRLSVGIEDPDDLWADLAAALDRVAPPGRE